MSGLVGIAGPSLDPAGTQAELTRMRELITLAGESHSGGDALFDGVVTAAVIHPSVRQAPDEPRFPEGFRCWSEGEIYTDLGPSDPRSAVCSAFSEVAPADRAVGADTPPTTVAALRAIDGVFVAVLYDRVARRVHLVTDRFGYGYVYWKRDGRRLVWSTTLAAFAASDEAPALDRLAVRQFLSLGHLVGDRSWFPGVSLLPPGSVLTYDIDTDRHTLCRYWWWTSLPTPIERPALREAAHELGRRFRAAVAKRCAPGETTGVLLSGGLDSRAVLAAAPASARLHAVSFGQEGCADLAVARHVARLRGVPHDIVTLDATNWLAPRLDALWLSGASSGLQHMHGVEAQPVCRELFAEYLSGFGGDNLVRGDYLQSKRVLDRFDADYIADYLHCDRDVLEGLDQYARFDRCDHYLFDTQVRRLWAAPRSHERTYLFERAPFMDNAVVDLVYMLPDRMRYKGRLYAAMLSSWFPEYFRRLGWANTGYPVTWPRGVRRAYRTLRMVERRLWGKVSTVGVPGLHEPSYADYPRWLREEPARSLVERLLTKDDPLYRDVVPDPEEGEAAWRRHLAGADETDLVFRHVTLELWLRQVYRAEYRPTP